jgi:hypothetical protein
MFGTVDMGQVSHITLEPFFANFTEKYFTVLAFLSFFYSADIFLDVKILFTSN